MASIEVRGSYAQTERWLNKLAQGDIASTLDSLGRRGVAALASATPTESGLTARSWNYRIKRSSNSVTIEWYNTNIVDGFPVAIGLQYGHGTGTGGYIAGRDYINPAIKPVFDDIEKAIERAVK